MKLNYKSRKGFTLIELLVVIGILAVLAAIAIPSVAGLIDRANVSADSTNASEYTNAIERFASEYELFYQDIASGTFNKNNMDSAQGRVYNVLNVEDRAGIEIVEVNVGDYVGENDIAIYRDTKYPANTKTARLIIQNYTKTSSSTFEPKQSDMHYWYSPDCGLIVIDTPTATYASLNSKVASGKDAKGNELSALTTWYDITLDYSTGIPELNVGNPDTELRNGQSFTQGDYKYTYVESYNGWAVQLATGVPTTKESYGPILETIYGKPIVIAESTFLNCTKLKVTPRLPDTIVTACSVFQGCTSLVKVTNIPKDIINMDKGFAICTSLTVAPDFSYTAIKNLDYTFKGCTALEKAPDLSRVNHHIDLNHMMLDCTALKTSVKLPPSSTCIVSGMYNGCTNLEKIELTCYITNREITFEGCDAQITFKHTPSCGH